MEALFPLDVAAVSELETLTDELPDTSPDVVPVFDPTIDYAKTLPVKLLRTGAYHADEVPYPTGEKWLGLFKVGDKYVLKPTYIINSKVADDGLFDREISVSNPNRSLFLLRGAEGFNPGEVMTLFDSEHDDFDFLSKKSFAVRGSIWWLWIENSTSEGFPQKGSSLVHKRTGMDEQVLRTLPYGCDDCGWNLLWVGDLNHDGQLDFLIDLSDHYNVSQPTLFLSSENDPGAVEIFASFRGVGC